MPNSSKIRDSRFWKRWARSGATHPIVLVESNIRSRASTCYYWNGLFSTPFPWPSTELTRGMWAAAVQDERLSYEDADRVYERVFGRPRGTLADLLHR